MTTRMLIDARHREETRVAVVTGNRIEEFDFESAEHKQLKGNIYLAKVTRVEPSLQAAFVDYGGNRHGFLAFSEIHPDYYQIPKEDRERLLAEEAEAAAEEAALREAEEAEDDEPGHLMRGNGDDEDDGEIIEVESDSRIDTIDMLEGEEPDLDASNGEDDSGSEEDGEEETGERGRGRNNRRGRGGRGGNNRGRGRSSAPKASDEARAKRMNIRRRYKIQDVIHRRQVLLVQVVKEERGNKGAALTSYLSLAGRYCVLMPNTSHGGGISRKINSATDRKRLKSIVSELKLPATMGCIIRTAGLARTKTEIKRDFDYLARLWDEIRERTLKGAAPMLIHTDSDLIKRAIRDIYNKDIDDVLIEGADGFKAAKDFMKLLMPSHAKRVKHYADPVSLFQRFHVEDQLNAMYNPVVQLKSGGYIVINPTEALVSIDINSGRSTKEHGIEQTALSTNLEAAREIARQLRLRDMAGLVVIDFIDMDHHSNARKVERAMKEALKNDRARIQVGRISSFGLMEMSRQRLRTGVLEASTRMCPHCEGTGLVRTASSSALSALRMIEEEAASGNGSYIRLSASQEASIYVLNNKRIELAEIEERYHVQIEIVPNGETEGAKMSVSSSGPRPEKPVMLAPMVEIEDDDDYEDIPEDEGEEESGEERDSRRGADGEERGDERGKRKRRRRGRRGGRGRDREGQENGSDNEAGDAGDAPAEAAVATDDGSDAKPKAARRGRRGGKKDAETAAPAEAVAEIAEAAAPAETAEAKAEKPKTRRVGKAKAKADSVAENAAAAQDAASEPAEKPKRASRAKAAPAKSVAEKPVKAAAAKKSTKPTKADAGKADAGKVEAGKADAEQPADSDAKKPAARTTRAKKTDDNVAEPEKAPAKASKPAKAVKAEVEVSENDGPPRKGWWSRTFG